MIVQDWLLVWPRRLFVDVTGRWERWEYLRPALVLPLRPGKSVLTAISFSRGVLAAAAEAHGPEWADEVCVEVVWAPVMRPYLNRMDVVYLN